MCNANGQPDVISLHMTTGPKSNYLFYDYQRFAAHNDRTFGCKSLRSEAFVAETMKTVRS